MASNEYRIDLNAEEVETLAEEIVSTTRPAPPAPNDLDNDHLQQLFAFSQGQPDLHIPFALILILKAFYEHSAGR